MPDLQGGVHEKAAPAALPRPRPEANTKATKVNFSFFLPRRKKDHLGDRNQRHQDDPSFYYFLLSFGKYIFLPGAQNVTPLGKAWG